MKRVANLGVAHKHHDFRCLSVGHRLLKDSRCLSHQSHWRPSDIRTKLSTDFATRNQWINFQLKFCSMLQTGSVLMSINTSGLSIRAHSAWAPLSDHLPKCPYLAHHPEGRDRNIAPSRSLRTLYHGYCHRGICEIAICCEPVVFFLVVVGCHWNAAQLISILMGHYTSR
jgi:hypothetical protein